MRDAQIGAAVADVHLGEIELRQPRGSSAQRRQVRRSSPRGRADPSGRDGRTRAGPARGAGSPSPRSSPGKTRAAQSSVGQAQIVPRSRPSRRIRRHLPRPRRGADCPRPRARVAVPRRTSRSCSPDELHDRDVLVARGRASVRLLPRCAPAERRLRRVRDPRGVDARVLVLDVDGGGAGTVRGCRERDRELAVRQPGTHEQRVAAPKRDAAAHDHLGVPLQLGLASSALASRRKLTGTVPACRIRSNR